MRTCTKCREVKFASKFYKHAGKASGYRSECKACTNSSVKTYQTQTESGRAVRNKNRRKWATTDEGKAYQNRANSIHRRKKKYGLDEAGMQRKLELQGWKCGICDAAIDGGSKTHVDHCHITGTVRDLLCFRCNSGLGHFSDDPHKLQKALEYLEKHGSRAVS